MRRTDTCTRKSRNASGYEDNVEMHSEHEREFENELAPEGAPRPAVGESFLFVFALSRATEVW